MFGNVIEQQNLVEQQSILTDDGVSLSSSEDFSDEEWAAVDLPLSSIKKVGIVQRVKNIFGSVIDFFVNPFKSKQTAPTLTMTDTHLGLVMSDDNDISSDRRRDHNNEGIFLDSSDSDSTSLDSSGGNLAVSFPHGHLKDINTEPQQPTAGELPAATGISIYVEEIDTEPQQHTTKLPAATLV